MSASEHEAIADWLGNRSEAYNITDYTDEQTTVITIEVERLAELIANRYADVRPWAPGDGDTRCQDCGHTYDPWFTAHRLWNEVMSGDPDAPADPGGYLCPRCFATRVEAVLPGLIWRFVPTNEMHARAQRDAKPVPGAD